MPTGPQRYLFLCSIEQTVKKIRTFQWEVSLYEFLCVCFGLGTALRFFTKLIKVPVSIFRKSYIRIIVYLDNFLILGNFGGNNLKQGYCDLPVTESRFVIT